MTRAEAHYYNAIVALLDELAPSSREAFDHELARARAYVAFLPKATTFERTKGKGSSHVPLIEPCPSCGRGGVHYEGSDVIEGDLEMNHLVHTEVEDLFACVRCGWEWNEPRFI